MSSAKANRTHWLPVPGLAVPVRVTLDAKSELDDLATTILRLIRIRPRRSDELAKKLGLDKARDLVSVALRELEDRFLIGPVEKGADVYELATEDIDDFQGTRIRTAWAFILPGESPTVLPRLWLGDEPPQAISNAKCEGRDFSEEHKNYYQSFRWKESLYDKGHPDNEELSRLLQDLVRRDDLQICSGKRGGNNGDVDEDSLALPKLVTDDAYSHELIRSIEADFVRRKFEPYDFTWTTLWVQVDLLPRIARAATVVYHEPDIRRAAYSTRPISPDMERWLESNDNLQPLRDHTEGLAQAMKEEFSLVLEIAGIENEAQLEAAVDAHRGDLEKRTDLSAPEDGEAVLPRRLTEKIRDAWRWLIISRNSPECYVRNACDAYAHAVEALTQALRDQALDELERWKTRWEVEFDTKAQKKHFEKSRRNTGWQADRMGIVGIEPGELGPSLTHLEGALNRLPRLPAAIARAEAQGAGNSLTLWLLPLFLLDDDEAIAYARPLRNALQCERFIMQYLDHLIDIRNDVFHDRRDELPTLGEIDRKLFVAWASLETGYGQARGDRIG